MSNGKGFIEVVSIAQAVVDMHEMLLEAEAERDKYKELFKKEIDKGVRLAEEMRDLQKQHLQLLLKVLLR